MAMRAAPPVPLSTWIASQVDHQYLACIDRADRQLLVDLQDLVDAGGLPGHWDGFTKWRFFSLLDVFQRNMDLDRRVLPQTPPPPRPQEAE